MPDEVQWHWKDARSANHRFAVDDERAVEAEYQRCKAANVSTGAATFNGSSYSLDFAKMEQTNTSTGKSRPLERKSIPVPETAQRKRAREEDQAAAAVAARPAVAAAAAVSAPFLRPRGDRARAVADAHLKEYDSDDSDDCRKNRPKAAKYAHLKHGDIVYGPGAYRGSQTYFVVQKGTKTSLVRDVDWSGYAQALSNVTYQIEDPLDFYSASPQQPTFISLQRPHHDAVIRRLIGDVRFRKLSRTHEIVWDTINDEEAGGGEE